MNGPDLNGIMAGLYWYDDNAGYRWQWLCDDTLLKHELY